MTNAVWKIRVDTALTRLQRDRWTAPAVRYMEIIDEVESVRRGPYGGSFGYIAFDGSLDMALTLRTMVITNARLHIQAGAGIVADSDPVAEELETRSKAAALMRAAERAAGGL